MTPLEAYLTALREIRSSGEAVVETSYYPALINLLDEFGKSLKPKVRCISQLKNRGVGSPDLGLFTEDQLKKRGKEESLPQNPARGVIEIKPTSSDAWLTADGEQVSRYWGKYRQVLVTNYRDFVFVGQDATNKPVKLETYRLAENEADFWNATAHPKKTAATHEAPSRNSPSAPCSMPPRSPLRRTLHGFSPPMPATPYTASAYTICLHSLPSAKRSKKLSVSTLKVRKASISSALRSSKHFSMASSPLGSLG